MIPLLFVLMKSDNVGSSHCAYSTKNQGQAIAFSDRSSHSFSEIPISIIHALEIVGCESVLMYACFSNKGFETTVKQR